MKNRLAGEPRLAAGKGLAFPMFTRRPTKLRQPARTAGNHDLWVVRYLMGLISLSERARLMAVAGDLTQVG